MIAGGNPIATVAGPSADHLIAVLIASACPARGGELYRRITSSNSSRYAAFCFARLRVLCSLCFERWVSVAAASASAASIVSFGAHNPRRRRCGRFRPVDATPPKTSPPLSPVESRTHPPTTETPNRRGSRFRHVLGSTGLFASCTRRTAVWSDRSRPHPNSRAK